MKVTYRDLYDNVPVLEGFAKGKTPWKVGLSLGKNILFLRPEWQLVEEARVAIAREFVEVKEGESVITDQEGFEKAYKALFVKEFTYLPNVLDIGTLEKVKDIPGAVIAALFALGIVAVPDVEEEE